MNLWKCPHVTWLNLFITSGSSNLAIEAAISMWQQWMTLYVLSCNAKHIPSFWRGNPVNAPSKEESKLRHAQRSTAKMENPKTLHSEAILKMPSGDEWCVCWREFFGLRLIIQHLVKQVIHYQNPRRNTWGGACLGWRHCLHSRWDKWQKQKNKTKEWLIGVPVPRTKPEKLVIEDLFAQWKRSRKLVCGFDIGEGVPPPKPPSL